MSKGNLIGKHNPPSRTKASGVWGIGEQYRAVKSSTWPVVYSYVTTGLVLDLDAGNPASYPGSGSTWKDLTGTVANGTLYNSPTYNSANGGYFSFNGSNQYAAFPNSTALDNQSFTVEVWIKTNNTSQNGFWFEKGSVNTQYSFFQEGAYIKFRLNGGDYVNPYTPSYLNTSSWYQMVGTYTYGAEYIYANTTLIGSNPTGITMNTNAGGMSIGAYGGATGSSSYFFNGNIAICRIYNRALSLAEIQKNYNEQKARFGL